MEWSDIMDWLNQPFFLNKKISNSALLLDILGILAIFFFTKLLLWFIDRVILQRFFRNKNTDLGRQFALRQFVKYILWSLAVFSMLEILGISNAIFASSAALLVGIGLGLQDTFKDLICGIVILSEGTVEVGDIVAVEGTVAIVTKIGLRVSKLETRDRIHILIPNSKLVVDSVTNWSYESAPNRFAVKVGVAYGSDLEKVKALLLEAAKNNSKVLNEPAPSVQFRDFGNSSLDFELFFFSLEFFRIEYVKSELRFAIDRLFQEHGITIPFPQTDLWIRNPEDLK